MTNNIIDIFTMKKKEGKIYIWSGTWDTCYLHIETYEFEVGTSLQLKNSKPDAVFEFSYFVMFI
jgi:hypothetical protein